MIPREEELVYRARWLVRVRWAVSALMVAAAFGARQVGIGYPLEWLLVLAGVVAIYNVLFLLARRWAGAGPRRAYRFVNIQISADYASLLFWIYFTGGAVSVFLPFFVFHLVLSGLLVGRWMTVVHAGLALVGLAGMIVGEANGLLPSYSPLSQAVFAAIQEPVLLFAVFLATAMTFLTIAFLVGGISDRLRGRELDLAEAQRELEVRSDRLQEAYVALRGLDREKSGFFRLASHQLRAPLASIQSVLRTVTAGYAAEPEKQAELVARAERQSGDMLALINDLLTLAQLESLDEAEQPQAVALAPLLEEVVDAWRNAAQAKEIALGAEIDPDLGTVSAVRNRLHQVFAVLVENAIKYTPRGGTVQVRAGVEGDRAVIAVRDTGIGIPDEARQKVFDEFYRAPNAKEHERTGTGLGLAIALRITAGLGGAITVESVVGEGTTFTVRLPQLS